MSERCSHGDHEAIGPLRDGLCTTHWWRQYLGRNMDAPLPKERRAKRMELTQVVAAEYLTALATPPGPGVRVPTLRELCQKHGIPDNGATHRVLLKLIREKTGGEKPKRPKAPRFCSVEGCGRPHQAHGLCQSHVLHMKKYGETRPIRAHPLQVRVRKLEERLANAQSEAPTTT